MIVSVHIPKCGGTTFLNFLRQYYSVYHDTQKPYMHCKKNEVTTDVVHGHFYWSKYEGRHITWIREPWARFKSHCNHEYRLRGELNYWEMLDKWCNIQSRLIGDPEDYEFIGVLEHWQRDINRFCDLFGLEYKPAERRRVVKDKIEIPRWVSDEFLKLNRADYQLYHRLNVGRRWQS